MPEQFQFQQFFGGFVTPFIFTIPRFGFFVALFPRHRFFHDNNPGNQSSMSIQRISEHEYMFMRRIGIMEVPVAMNEGYRENAAGDEPPEAGANTLGYMPDRPGTTIPFPWPVDLSNAALSIVDGFLYVLYTDRPTYLPGQPVHIMFISTNISPVPRRLVYPTSQMFDLAVVQNEREIWRWSRDRAFLPAVSVCELLPGQSQIFPVVWNQEANNELGLEVGPGLFTLRASNMAAELQNEAVDLRVSIQLSASPTESCQGTP